MDRFKNGGKLTHGELKDVFYNITGRQLPTGSDSRTVAQTLSRSHSERFEFEVNRLRGFAWNHGEV